MSKTFFLTLAMTTLLGAGLLGSPALAQISPQPGGQIRLGADSERLDSNAHTLMYDGKVEILQNESRLRCDHAVVTQSAGSGEISSIEATGAVYYVTRDTNGQQSVVRGDRAVYTQASDTIVITGGEVILVQGQNVMAGTRLVVQVSKGLIAFDTPAQNGKGRVRGVFYPATAR